MLITTQTLRIWIRILPKENIHKRMREEFYQQMDCGHNGVAIIELNYMEVDLIITLENAIVNKF